MRRFLDRLYEGALMLSALAFASIAVLVLVQVTGRILDRLARVFGFAPPGITVPSLAEIGGFLFLSAVFLGLAGALNAGDHIRVTLMTRVLPVRIGRALALIVTFGAAALAGFATWSSGLQAWDSASFGSVSYGMVRVPLWLPQGVMTLGLGLLCLALVDASVALLRGRLPAFEKAENAKEAR